MADKGNTDEAIVTYVGRLGDGTHIVEHADGRLERMKNQTDWAAIDALTDQQIEEAVRNDPDWSEFEDVDWSKAVLVMPPKKTAISIRLDDDVLTFFKREGSGYQRRINAVLRSFMQQKAKPANKSANKPKKRA